jgi:phage terminase large subunit-like protein
MAVHEWYEENYIQKPKDAVTVAVMEDLKTRADRGVQKYSTTLEENNHDDFLNHLYEELLDAAQYVKKEITVRENIQQLIKAHNNDSDLGAKIRAIYNENNRP